MATTGMTASVDALAELVSCESPSADPVALAKCADVVDAIAGQRIGTPGTRVSVDGRVHLHWTFGAPRVLLLGHFDTVWPVGTLDRWPFAVAGDRATGPGCFDMKAGIVQLFAALSQLDDLDGVVVLLTSDEEIGSPTSQPLIEDVARGLEAAFVLEPSADGALKTARKGVGLFDLEVTGRAAHAGLEPEKGVNAAVEAARQLLDISKLSNEAMGTTVTPTVVRAGTTVNTVPSSASVAVDVRAATAAEMSRVRAALESLRPYADGATVRIVPQSVRPPLDAAMSAALFERAQGAAEALGIGPLPGVAVGGGSDGNHTAGLGVPTLDGLGAVGGSAHAEGEWVSLAAIPQRAALVAALVRGVLETEGR